MQIQISSKHLDLTPAIESYVHRKIEKFPRYFDRVQQIDVVIDKQKTDYTIEVITDVERHDPFIATARHEDLYACIDMVVDKSIRQLTDHKSKLRDNKHHTPTGEANHETA
ncbi:MAG TPA: ribosome-associated translation inhibitor RaiA [Phycisphaerales bacterium]|nr:ribosome-associated translation inhibitor RaiA [Phycisphaerales bacterium]HRQ75979.1 ribosome-associated translation inhibitor RaiA [Phycisphaerales bacterium]